MNKFIGWKTFNDRLALLVLVGIPVLWALSGRGTITLAPEVVGALIATWTLIVQLYFRRHEIENGTPPTVGTPATLLPEPKPGGP